MSNIAELVILSQDEDLECAVNKNWCAVNQAIPEMKGNNEIIKDYPSKQRFMGSQMLYHYASKYCHKTRQIKISKIIVNSGISKLLSVELNCTIEHLFNGKSSLQCNIVRHSIPHCIKVKQVQP